MCPSSGSEFPDVDLRRGSHPGADRRRPQHHLLRRRLVVAGPCAPPHRALRRQRGGDPHLAAFPLPVAPRGAASLCLDGGQCRPRRRSDPEVPGVARGKLCAGRHRRRGGPAVGAAQAHLRPPLQGGHRLFAARLYPGAPGRGGEADAGDGHGPVEAIGREVGYEDAASFRRLFRRLAGMAPGDYRKKFRIPKEVAEVAAVAGLPSQDTKRAAPNLRSPSGRAKGGVSTLQ